MAYVGGYAPSIIVEERPERISADEAIAKAKAEGVNAFKPYDVTDTYDGGNVRALFIGINYTGQAAELSGCVNDVHQTLATMEEIAFPIDEAAILVDDPTFPNVSDTPTVANMKKYLGWLIADAKAGDVLYLHYSGHGGRVKAEKDTEEEYDSCLIPVDYTTNGTILDDDLYKILAEPLAAGVRMTICFDCCHSASMLDLPYCFIATEDVPDDNPDDTHYSMNQKRQDNFSNGDVLMLSGCTDEGTSADVGNTATFASSDIKGAGGAATQAWTYMLENMHGSKYIDAIIGCRKALVEKGFTQIPQLSCSKPLDLDKPFSLFGLLTVDEKMQDTLPEEFNQPPPEITGIPPRFRHQFMNDFDPSVFQNGFLPPRPPNGGFMFMNNNWSRQHGDPRHQMRMNYMQQFGPRGRGMMWGGGPGMMRGGPMMMQRGPMMMGGSPGMMNGGNFNQMQYQNGQMNMNSRQPPRLPHHFREGMSAQRGGFGRGGMGRGGF
ncbi:metacaspase [Angomonas deanei]|nr:metacaspase [Angomonas deanei]|eukprot:EPY16315.1 metacaspase [Angomonas deanei]